MNHRQILPILYMCAIAAIAPKAIAQTDSVESKPLRPVAAAYTIGVGALAQTDTYLSPLRYTGTALSLGYERFQAMGFCPDNWVMRLYTNLDLTKSTNPAGNADAWGASLDIKWGMMRRWQLRPSVYIGVGPEASLRLGALYNQRNGNNPVNARAAINIGITAFAAYNFTLKRLPITLRYQPSLPLLGTFFAPQYGELYYEIYLGDDSNLMHPGCPGNYFDLDNLLCADLRFGGTWLRLGYRLRYITSYANHITTRYLTNSFVIGLSGEWISLNSRRGLPTNARVVSALY